MSEVFFVSTKVNLKTIVDELDFLSEEFSSYLNQQTGEVVHIAHEDMREVEEEEDEDGDDEKPDDAKPAWKAESLAIARAVAADDQGIYVPLPSQFDIHEYEIMADFCRSVRNKQISDSLCRMIQGRGAFGRFKDSIRQYGIEENWYKFRDWALKEIVKEWCEAEGIEYIDDEPAAEEAEDEGLSEKEIFYRTLGKSIAELLGDERDFLANAANVAAVLYEELPEVNWAGFYLLKGQDLVLGPFQGKPACTRIGPGKGVCGAAARSGRNRGRRKRQKVPRAYRLRQGIEVGNRGADGPRRAVDRRAGRGQPDSRPFRRRGPRRPGRDRPRAAGSIGRSHKRIVRSTQSLGSIH